MLNLFAVALAASAFSGAQPAATPVIATPAPAARPLSAVPGIQINYYDVAGTNGRAISKSIDEILKAPSPNNAARVYDWNIGGSVVKEQAGAVCTVKSAKLTLTASAWLPRLRDQAKVPADVLTQWKPYAASVEKLASDNLWFVADRMPAIEQSLTGKPCADVQNAMNTAVSQLRDQQMAFAKEAAARTAAAQAAQKAGKKPTDKKDDKQDVDSFYQ